jgi:hypothetical protein
MTKEKKEWWQLIGDVKKQYIFLVLLLCFTFPLIYPLGIPVQIQEPTLSYYKIINNLKEGDVVLDVIGFGIGMMGDKRASCEITLKHMLLKVKQVHCKLIITPLTLSAGIPTIWYILNNLGFPDKGYFEGLKYGEDYVILSYIPGGETAVKSFAANIWDTYPVYYANTPMSKLPMMTNIKSANDITLLSESHGDTDMGYIMKRQWFGTYGTTMLTAGGGVLAGFAVYYPHIEKGIVAGNQGAAEYEKLMGLKGIGTAYSDVWSTIALYMLALIIMANISSYYTRKKKEGGL